MGARVPMRAALAVRLLALVLIPLGAAEAAVAVPSSNRVCQEAGKLARDGQPQRALELIAVARGAVPADRAHRRCAPQYAIALRRQSRAERIALWVGAAQAWEPDEGTDVPLPAVLATPPPTCQPGTPLPTVSGVVGKADLRTGVDAALACDGANTRALAAEAALDKKADTEPEELSSAWDDLKSDYLDPWSGLLTAFLIWMLGAPLLVRLLPYLVHSGGLILSRLGTPGRMVRTLLQASGWVLVARGAWVATVGAADARGWTDDALGAALLWTLAGVFVIDQSRRIAPRLKVDATGDGVPADHVRVVLHGREPNSRAGWRCRARPTPRSSPTSASPAAVPILWCRPLPASSRSPSRSVPGYSGSTRRAATT